jgi:hypothetical protein
VAGETLTIAGKKYPKKVLYIAGAGAAGFVGYAWFTRGRSTGETPLPETPDPVPEPEDDPGFDVIGGGGPPGTNAAWSELALERLINIGLNGPAVSAAIGKFLQRLPLNSVEADLVRQAIRAAGYPPENGPWVIIPETPGTPKPPPVKPPPVVKPPPTKPPATTPPKVTPPPGIPGYITAVGGRGYADIAWFRGANTTSFEISRMEKNTRTPWQNIGNVTHYRAKTLVKVPTQYAFAVRARGPGGVSGDAHTKVVWVYP